MSGVIRIFHGDTEEEAQARHLRIQTRLDELGAEQVKAMMGHGFPTEWNPIVGAWIAGQRIEAKKESDGGDQGRTAA
jgi:hypothetical protein